MPFRFNPITGKLDLVDIAPVPPVPAQTTFVTDTGNATSVSDSINVFGGANINTAGTGATVTIALDTDVVTNSYSTDTLATNVKIEDNTITAGGTDANVDIGLVTKGDGGAYTPNNLTVGQPFSVTSIPFLGGNLDVAMLIDTEGFADLGGTVENRHGNTAGFGAHHILARSRGTHAAPTTILSNDTIGRFASFGFDGTEYVGTTEITTSATGTIAAGKVPGQFVFSTADDVTGALQTAMTIDNGQTTTVPRLVGTANITAGFATPNLTTELFFDGGDQIITNNFSTVMQSTNLSGFTAEYFGAVGGGTTESGSIVFTRSLGTKAAPVRFTSAALADQSMIGMIRFGIYRAAGLTTPKYTTAGTISCFGGGSTGIYDRINISRERTSSTVSATGGTSFYTNYPDAGFRIFTSSGIYVNTSFLISRTFNPTTLFPDRFLFGTSTTDFSSQNVMAGIRGNLQITAASATVGGSLDLGRVRGALTVRSVVQIDDNLGNINFGGVTATGNLGPRQAAQICAEVDAAITTTRVQGRILFKTIDSTGTLQEAMRIDSAQRITQPLQPSFSASLSADVVNETGDGTAYTIAFDTMQYDQGANFAANTFTAPIAGKYRFAYTISVDDLAVGHTKLELSVGGRVVERCNPYAIADSDGFCLLSGMVDLSLAAAATVTMVVTVSGSTKTVTVKGTTSSGTFLSGQLQV